MVESTVNNFRYESVTTNVWMPLYRESQRLYFHVGLLGKLWILIGALLPYL